MSASSYRGRLDRVPREDEIVCSGCLQPLCRVQGDQLVVMTKETVTMIPTGSQLVSRCRRCARWMLVAGGAKHSREIPEGDPLIAEYMRASAERRAIREASVSLSVR